MRVSFFVFFLIITINLFSQIDEDLLKNYMDNYQYNKAIEYLQDQEQTKEALLAKALCYKGLDNYKAAIDILIPLKDIYVNDIKIKSQLAICYQALSNWEESLKCYKDLMSVDTANIYYQKQHADMLFRLEKYEDALAEYRFLTDNYKMDNLIKRSAQCYELMNMPDSALVYYKKAWEKDSTDSFSVANIVNVNLKQYNQSPTGEKSPEYIIDAIESSETYMKRDSTNKQINLLNALSYYTMDMYIEAIPRFEKCFQVGDSSLIVNRSLGLSLYSMGENELAKPYLEKVYNQDSTNINVIYCLGTISNELRDYQNGLKYFTRLMEKAIPKDLTLFSYYKGIAKAYQGNENYREAVDNYILAEKYAGKNQKIALFYEIAMIYDYDLGMPDEALSYYLRYRLSMENYLQELKEKEASQLEIEEMEGKLKGLNTHISRLEKTVKRKN